MAGPGSPVANAVRVRALLLLLLLASGPAWAEPALVDLVPERLPATLVVGDWGPGDVRVTNRGTTPWPAPGRQGMVAWEIAESPDGPPVYLDYAPIGAPVAPGESRLVGLHLGGAVREGRAWLRVRPVLVGNDFPDVQGVQGTAELPVAAGTSWWARWHLPLLAALRWGYVAALAAVALLALRARR